MDRLVLQDSEMAQWQALICAAAERAECTLDEELESYLVFTLSRFARRPYAVSGILAIDFLDALNRGGGSRRTALRDLGDRCLLVSGLFPEQAHRRLVGLNYFVDMGRCAYDELAGLLQYGYADLYQSLSDAFIHLINVLLAFRDLGNPDLALQPLTAAEIWQATGSRVARRALQRHTAATPIHR